MKLDRLLQYTGSGTTAHTVEVLVSDDSQSYFASVQQSVFLFLEKAQLLSRFEFML